MDRELKITELPDGTIKVEGVLFEVGKPNVNGIVRTKGAVRFALSNFNPVPLTKEFSARECVGSVDCLKVIDGYVVATATIRGDFERGRLEKALEDAGPKAAFNSIGVGEFKPGSDVLVKEYTLKGVEVVELSSLLPEVSDAKHDPTE